VQKFNTEVTPRRKTTS